MQPTFPGKIQTSPLKAEVIVETWLAQKRTASFGSLKDGIVMVVDGRLLSSENGVGMATDQVPAYEILLEPAAYKSHAIDLPRMRSADGWSPNKPYQQIRAAVRMRLCERRIVRFAALGFETDDVRSNMLFYYGRVGKVGVSCWPRQTEPPAPCDEEEITRSGGRHQGGANCPALGPLLPLLAPPDAVTITAMSCQHSGWLLAVSRFVFQFHCWPAAG